MGLGATHSDAKVKPSRRESVRANRGSQGENASRDGASSRDKPRGLRRDQAVETIRDMILSGDPSFKSGEILSENLLAERLGLTKAPIRQALSQLENEGLVSIIPRVGTQVRLVRPEEAQAIMALRFAIETIVVGELARARPDIEPLRSIHKEMQDIAQGMEKTSRERPPSRNTKAMIAFVKADMEFHAKMAELADGYSAALRTLKDVTGQFFLYALRAILQTDAVAAMHDMIREHEELINAIEDGRADEAVALLQRHLKNSVDRLTPFASSYLEHQLPKYVHVRMDDKIATN